MPKGESKCFNGYEGVLRGWRYPIEDKFLVVQNVAFADGGLNPRPTSGLRYTYWKRFEKTTFF